MKNIFLCFSFILSISLPCFAQDTDTKLDEGENPSTLKTHYKKSQLPTSEAARMLPDWLSSLLTTTATWLA